jgi:hypothetical protein
MQFSPEAGTVLFQSYGRHPGKVSLRSERALVGSLGHESTFRLIPAEIYINRIGNSQRPTFPATGLTLSRVSGRQQMVYAAVLFR